MLPILRNVSIAAAVTNVKSRAKFPKKLKGTIIEKWANYWKNLFIDYNQMINDLRQDIQEEPIKALAWGAGLAASYGLMKNKPNERDFKDNMKIISNEMVLVSAPCQNTTSIEHLRYLQMCYNEGVIHYRSLGIVSFMYTTELNKSCDLYRAQCKYLQPSILSLPWRVVDIGFMGRWWNIFIKTTNYDVNQ